MGLYNFDARFVPAILSGWKRHTIRACRERPDEAGDTLHLYTGLRRRGARLLMRVPCVKVEMIEITLEGVRAEVYVNMAHLDAWEREQLARRDGFWNFAEMRDFWEGRLPFTGQIVHWDYERRALK